MTKVCSLKCEVNVKYGSKRCRGLVPQSSPAHGLTPWIQSLQGSLHHLMNQRRGSNAQMLAFGLQSVRADTFGKLLYCSQRFVPKLIA